MSAAVSDFKTQSPAEAFMGLKSFPPPLGYALSFHVVGFRSLMDGVHFPNTGLQQIRKEWNKKKQEIR